MLNKQLFLSGLALVLLFLSLINVVGASFVIWDETYGGELDDETASIVEAENGGFVIAGTTYSFGAGDADLWLIKVNETGLVDWNQTYGGPESDVLNSLIKTRNGGYLIAGITSSFGNGDSDCWLVKVDSFGNIQWNRTYGFQIEDAANSVIQTNDGGYVIAGYSTDNNTNTDILFFKTDSSGDLEWNQTYGGAGSDVANSVVKTADGGYALIGRTSSFGINIYYTYSWLIKTDSEGNLEWDKVYRDKNNDSKSYFAQTIIQTSEGGYAFVDSPGFIIGLRDIWLAHVDAEGNMEWNVTCVYGGPSFATSLIQTNDNGYLVSGYTSSLGNYPGLYSYFHLAKVDSDGSLKWVKNYDGLGDNKALFVVETDDDNYAIAGTTQTTEEGAHFDIWFARIDRNGAIIPENNLTLFGFLSLGIILITVKVGYTKRDKK